MNQETILEQEQTSFLEGKNLECSENINEFISTFIIELKDALQNFKENKNFDNFYLKESSMEENSNLENGFKLEEDLEKNLEVEYYTIDRFEGGFAVCENRKSLEMVNIPKSKIPSNAKEGQILKMIDDKFELDLLETDKVKNEIKEKYNHLWEE